MLVNSSLENKLDIPIPNPENIDLNEMGITQKQKEFLTNFYDQQRAYQSLSAPHLQVFESSQFKENEFKNITSHVAI